MEYRLTCKVGPIVEGVEVNDLDHSGNTRALVSQHDIYLDRIRKDLQDAQTKEYADCNFLLPCHLEPPNDRYW